MERPTNYRSAFTLIEVLIVVVILGILASVVTASLFQATRESAEKSTIYELKKLRRALEVYKIQQRELPVVTAGEGTWGGLVGREYLTLPPVNTWVGGDNARTIVIGTSPDGVAHGAYGWIYDPATGNVWAASFDGNDRILP